MCRPTAAPVGAPAGGVALLLAKFQAQSLAPQPTPTVTGNSSKPAPSSSSTTAPISSSISIPSRKWSPAPSGGGGSGTDDHDVSRRQLRLRGLERSESVSKRVSSGPWSSSSSSQLPSSSNYGAKSCSISATPSSSGSTETHVAVEGLGLGRPSTTSSSSAQLDGPDASAANPHSRPPQPLTTTLLDRRRVSDELERLLGERVGSSAPAAGQGPNRISAAPGCGANSCNDQPDHSLNRADEASEDERMRPCQPSASTVMRSVSLPSRSCTTPTVCRAQRSSFSNVNDDTCDGTGSITAAAVSRLPLSPRRQSLDAFCGSGETIDAPSEDPTASDPASSSKPSPIGPSSSIEVRTFAKVVDFLPLDQRKGGPDVCDRPDCFFKL